MFDPRRRCRGDDLFNAGRNPYRVAKLRALDPRVAADGNPGLDDATPSGLNLNTQNSAVSTQHSALAFRTQNSALSTQHSHSELRTQPSALAFRTQNSALSTRIQNSGLRTCGILSSDKSIRGNS